MPEGPSILILKEKLSYLRNKTVTEASGYVSLDLEALIHHKIMDFKTWGKHLLICFSGFTIRVHLGLFGTCQLHEPKKVNPSLALHFHNDSVYFYVCTIRRIDEPLDEVYDWSADIMDAQWSTEKALEKIQKKGNRKICDVLLDQQIFSGAGNIIKNEVLFRTHVHPESVVKNIPLQKLREVADECRNYSFDFLKWRKRNELSKHYEVYQQKELRGTNQEVTRKDTGTSRRSSYFVKGVQKLYS